MFRQDYMKQIMDARVPLHDMACSICSMALFPAGTPGVQESPNMDFALQCQECHTMPVYCRACLLAKHRLLPYHKIGIAQPGRFFKPTTLTEQKYIFHLHPGNQPCPSSNTTAMKLINNFVIVHSDSINTFQLKTCSCDNRPIEEQLISACLFPATFERPKTAFTFAGLDYFLLDNTICHTTAYSFYEKLKHRTNPLLALTKSIPVSISFY
jgi:hypothetical protein